MTVIEVYAQVCSQKESLVIESVSRGGGEGDRAEPILAHGVPGGGACLGPHRVTLEPGYTRARIVTPSADAARRGLVGDSVEVVPASLVSPNPVVVMAQEGRIPPLRLSPVDTPGTAAEPEATCMNGS